MNETGKISLIIKDKDMTSVISQNSRDSLYAILKRLNVYVEDSWDKDVLSLTLKDVILDHPEYILYIHGKDLICFLIMLWESKEIEMSQFDWTMLGQLKILGFVDYVNSVFPGGKIKTIEIIKEAKDALYFYLKSKNTRRLIEKYEKWEIMIRGMMSYYGIISFQRLYIYFCKICQEPVDDDVFRLFLSVRINLMPLGGFVMETSSGTEYYQNFEVSDPEKLLDACIKERQIDYYLPDEEDLLFVGKNNGLGEWDGISDLADFLMNDLEIDYYKTIVMIKSCILMIQNAEGFESTVEQFFTWCPEAECEQQRIRKDLSLLYESVPVFTLKGWSRKDLKRIHHRTPSLKMLKGGKDGSEKGGNII